MGWGGSDPPLHAPSIFLEQVVHAREEIIEVIARHLGVLDFIEGSVVEVLVIEFADEGGGLAAGFLAPFHANGAVGERKGFLGAGDADVEQAAFLVLGALGDGAAVREETFLQPDEIDDGKLQPL